MKYPDKRILFAKEEMVVQGMNDKLFVIERYRGMATNLDEN
jgi:hypothetical protein